MIETKIQLPLILFSFDFFYCILFCFILFYYYYHCIICKKWKYHLYECTTTAGGLMDYKSLETFNELEMFIRQKLNDKIELQIIKLIKMPTLIIKNSHNHHNGKG